MLTTEAAHAITLAPELTYTLSSIQKVAPQLQKLFLLAQRSTEYVDNPLMGDVLADLTLLNLPNCHLIGHRNNLMINDLS